MDNKAVAAGRNLHYEGQHGAEEPEDTAQRLALVAERDRLRAALVKIDAIRNDIIGRQRIGWSSHVYPLVEALGEAGFDGLEYEAAKAVNAQGPNAQGEPTRSRPTDTSP